MMMFDRPNSTLEELYLENYEIVPVEPLHAVKGISPICMKKFLITLIAKKRPYLKKQSKRRLLEKKPNEDATIERASSTALHF